MNNDIISTAYQDALFVTLRSAIRGEKLALPKDIDADKLLQIAGHQNLFPLVFSCLMQNTEFVNTDIYIKFLPEFYAEFSAQVKRTDAFLKLYPEFADKGIYPLVVKGIICRELYGDYAESRPSGDEDLFVKKSEFFEAAKILEENGFTPERDNVTEKQLETLHDVGYERKDLRIELHVNLMSHRTELRRRMNGYFASAIDNGISTNIRGVSMKTLNHTDHFLYLVFHAFNHFISSGVGIRQMTDILLYYQKYGDKIDMEYILGALVDTNSTYFLSDLIRIGNKYLGFSIEPLCEEKDIQILLEDICQMGTFGNTSAAHIMAEQMTSAAFSGGNTFLSTIFPSKEWLMKKYPELAEKPYLLPICWVKRWGTFFKKRKDKDTVSDSIAVSKRRIELLKQYEIL